MAGIGRHCLHSVTVTTPMEIAWWPLAGDSPAPHWNLIIDPPGGVAAASALIRTGEPQWQWMGLPPESAATTWVGVSGGPPPGSGRTIEVDWGRRTITLSSAGHSVFGLRGGLDLVARWIVPLIARTQRSTVPVRATSLVWQGQALVLAGHSGAGKSTLAAALVQQGAQLLGDEPVLLGPSEANVVAWPGESVVRLNQESQSLVGPVPGMTAVQEFDNKVVMQCKPDFSGSMPAPVLAVCHLVARHPHGSSPILTRKDPVSALLTLVRQGYSQAGSRDLVRADFRNAELLANRVAVVEVSMPDGGEHLMSAAAQLPTLIAQAL